MEISYEKQKRGVFIGLALLAAITIVEVLVSLYGKGHIFGGTDSAVVLAIVALLIIGLSLYKARFIIFEFMHMGHEMPNLKRTVLWPTLLLTWAIIAFIWEGNYWKGNRQDIQDKNKMEISKDEVPQQQGLIIKDWSTQLR